MNNREIAENTLLIIREKILSQIVKMDEIPTLDQVWQLRSRLHSFELFAIRSEFDQDLRILISALLSTSGALWQLIAENEETTTDLKEYTRVRTLAAEAEGLTNLEELISGEDTLRDVIINSIAFMLNWKSNTIWIDTAKRSQKALANRYRLEIQDRIWEFVKISSRTDTQPNFDQIDEIRQKTDQFMRLIQDEEMTISAEIAILLQLYVLLIRMQLGKIIIRLEAMTSDDQL